MLLFTDGFEHFDVFDLYHKWHFAQVPYVFNYTLQKYTSDSKIDSGYDPIIPDSPVSRKGGRSLFIAGHDYANLGVTFRKSRTVYVGFAARAKTKAKIQLVFASCQPETHKPSNGPCNGYDVFTPWGNNYAGMGSAIDNFEIFPNYNLASDTRYTGTGPIERSDIGSGGYAIINRNTDSRRINCGIAKCTITIDQTIASFQFNFADGISTQYGYINYNANAFAGGFFYYQIGITTLGCNPVAGNSSWVEARIGSGLTKRWQAQCETCDPDKPTNFYINSLLMKIAPGSSGLHLDDFYVANEEGDVNNDFLGPIFIRSSTCMSQGSVNKGIPVNCATGNNGDAVKGDFLSGVGRSSTLSNGSTLISTTDTENLRTEFTNPYDSCVVLNTVGDEQRFLINSIDFNGASPNILGAAIYSMVRARNSNCLPTTLTTSIIPGNDAPVVSVPLQRPITYGSFWFSYDWLGHLGGRCYSSSTYCHEIRSFIFENDTDFSVIALNPDYINNCEISFTLSEHDELGTWYPNFTRESVTFDEIVSDSISLFPIASRYCEEMISDTFEFSNTSDAQWGATSADDLIFFDAEYDYQAYQHAIDEPVVFSDYFSDFQIYVCEIFSIDGDSVVTFPLSVDDNIAFIDSGYGFWVEEVMSPLITHVDDPTFSAIYFVDDTISIESSDIWDNHLDGNEELIIESSDVWDNHLDGESFLALDEYTVPALIELVNDFFDLVEDHFDGYWVEQWNESLGVTDSVLTMVWRFEWFLGVLINAYQLQPIEQEGNEGLARIGEFNPGMI